MDGIPAKRPIPQFASCSHALLLIAVTDRIRILLVYGPARAGLNGPYRSTEKNSFQFQQPGSLAAWQLTKRWRDSLDALLEACAPGRPQERHDVDPSRLRNVHDYCHPVELGDW